MDTLQQPQQPIPQQMPTQPIPDSMSQPMQPSIPEPIEQHKSHFLRDLSLFILLLIIVGGAAYGGYFYGQQTKTTAPTIYPAITRTPISPTPLPASPSGQLTYTDTTLGVSFLYPNTWEVVHVQSVDGYWLQLKPKSQSASATYSGPILISIAPHTTFDAQNLSVKGIGSVTTQTTLAGLPAYQMTNPNCEPFMCSLAIAVIHNGTGYILNNFKPVQDVPAPADQQTTFDLLVKTFTFTK